MEKNKGVAESRTLESRPVAAEDIGFPFAAQAALVTRQHVGRKDETVGLITDLSPQELPPRRGSEPIARAGASRMAPTNAWMSSLNDDRCRVRNPNGLWILGMLRRVAISLYMHWRERQPKPRSLWFTDFQAAMGEDNLAKAFAFVTNRRPKLT